MEGIQWILEEPIGGNLERIARALEVANALKALELAGKEREVGLGSQDAGQMAKLLLHEACSIK